MKSHFDNIEQVSLIQLSQQSYFETDHRNSTNIF